MEIWALEGINIIASIFDIVQMYLLSNKNRWGFVFGILSGILWILYAVITNSAYGIFIIAPISAYFAWNGFLSWGKQDGV
jgi:hypothetical protein